MSPKQLDRLKKNVTAALKRLDWSQSDLAKRMGVQQSQISAWLNGVNAITVDTLLQMAKETGTYAADLLAEDDVKPSVKVEKSILIPPDKWAKIEALLAARYSQIVNVRSETESKLLFINVVVSLIIEATPDELESLIFSMEEAFEGRIHIKSLLQKGAADK